MLPPPAVSILNMPVGTWPGIWASKSSQNLALPQPPPEAPPAPVLHSPNIHQRNGPPSSPNRLARGEILSCHTPPTLSTAGAALRPPRRGHKRNNLLPRRPRRGRPGGGRRFTWIASVDPA